MRARLLISFVALLASGVLSAAQAQVMPLIAPPTSADAAPAAPLNAGEDLRRLAVGGHTGFLQGESANHEWPIYVKDPEVGKANTLQIGFSASVSDSPEVSKLHVFVNDHQVGDIELKGGETDVVRRLKLDPGLLAPGLNSVRIGFESVHRVDCSAQATYELWARINPTTTGLVFPEQGGGSASRDLTDLLTVHADANGVTPIYVRTPLNPEPAEAARLIRVVNALANSLRLPSPVVQFGEPPQGDAGLELAVGTHGEMNIDKVDVSGRTRISVGTNDNRPLILLSGADDSSVGQQVDALVADLTHYMVAGSPQGLRAAAQVSGVAIDGDAIVKLGQLGIDDESGHGRRRERTVTLSLPQNFVPSVYEHATLRLKGSIPGGLLEGSNVNVRINGVGASSVPIAGDNAFDLEGQALYLPFAMFHPGVNKLTFETVTVSAEDEVCETTTHRQRALLNLSPESTITFPHFARLAVGPEVSRALAVRSADGADHIHVALIRADRDSLSAAMTLFANLAQQGRRTVVDVTYGPPTTLAESGIAFGPLDAIPGELTRGLRNLYLQGAEAIGYENHGVRGELQPMTAAEGAGGVGGPRAIWVRIVRDLRWVGFAFDDPTQRQKLIVSNEDLFIGEAPIGGWGFARAGFAVPTIGAAPSTWLVVASRTNEQLSKSLSALAASDKWDQFHGQAAVFEPSTGRVASISRTPLFYALPRDWTFSDLRDAMAVIFSDHIVAYVGVLLLLTTMLSAATMGLLTHLHVHQNQKRSGA